MLLLFSQRIKCPYRIGRRLVTVNCVRLLICTIFGTVFGIEVSFFIFYEQSWKPWLGQYGQVIPPYKSDFKSRSDFVTYFSSASPVRNSSSDNQNRTILFWTGFFGYDSLISNDVFSECPLKSKCRIVTDRKLLLQSDAVIFHARDTDKNDFPPKRFPSQRWILYSIEPPFYDALLMSRYNGVFNWTMMMRNDSDIPTSYGSVFLDRHPLTSTEHATELHSIRQNIRMKNKSAVALISNCITTQTNRLHFVRELQKYYPVDFYGRCGDLDCKSVDCTSFFHQYKFYLALENGFCRNYITEKLWRAFHNWHNVPIVSGGSHPDDYRAVAPHYSYINVADFESPQDLAKYLHFLSESDLEYEKLFYWKFKFTRSNIVGPQWCNLCHALFENSSTRPAQVYRDLHGWVLDNTCDYRSQIVIYVVGPLLGIVIIFIFTCSLYILSRVIGKLVRHMKYRPC